ncbi:MAG: fluoride efflux transporter CrcB [Candidatus Omnitrophota bacterium]|nr:fluoride efflux transporter CrcB [Candidatus Omnitrophota bacterium]MBU1894652.1 fluoride efflux transporter CrcB [Candidatus Omnitrophota bacterium]
MKLLYLATGGALGAVLRYFLSGRVYKFMGTAFPYGTLMVNMAACFIMGFLMSFAETKFVLSPNIRIFLMIGFVGAFSTFSTFIFETDNLIKDSEMMKALMNVGLSIFCSFLMFRVGAIAGRFL